MKLKISSWKNKIRKKEDRDFLEALIGILNFITSSYIDKKEYDTWNKKGIFCTFNFNMLQITLNKNKSLFETTLEVIKGTGKTPNSIRIRIVNIKSVNHYCIGKVLCWGKAVFNNIDLINETCDINIDAYKELKKKIKINSLNINDITYKINKFLIDNM